MAPADGVDFALPPSRGPCEDRLRVLDLFTLALVILVVTIVAFIVRAVRLANDSIARASRDAPLSRPDVARRMADEIRARDVRCPRCGAEASAVLGAEHRYTCDVCTREFEGPAHIPTDRR
jgi:hypothetical protein